MIAVKYQSGGDHEREADQTREEHARLTAREQKGAPQILLCRWREHLAVESAVNQVISKRFVKKQQMRWTPRGAHLLLQTRIKVLNGDLEDTFRRWYPAFRSKTEAKAA
jgi:hypothetical protein